MEFEWDEHNLRHILDDSPHGLTPRIVYLIASSGPQLFPNKPGAGRSGSHMMIGTAAEGDSPEGNFWTVILLKKGDDLWRPITGWPSTGSEIRLFMGREE